MPDPQAPDQRVGIRYNPVTSGYMLLRPGARVGPFEIQSAIGAGGMGEVYRARDTRLDRIVAIKVLSEHIARDPDFRARFEREAKAISQLNHPHICALHDFGHDGQTDYLVLEYLEGETLAARLERGALPVDEAVALGVQIADALALAHRYGIVHRDLKPGNVMIAKGGAIREGSLQAKLLDFGLATAAGPHVAESVSQANTMTGRNAALTAEGTILGTFQYMAPEQLEGRKADARSDIWAFGAVLYEMLTGTRAFDGKSRASLIAAIMQVHPPPVAERQPLASRSLSHIVQRCLEKAPEDRWQSIGDVGRELKWAASVGEPVAQPRPQGRGWRAAGWIAASLVLLAAGFGIALLLRHRAAPSTTPIMKLTILPLAMAALLPSMLPARPTSRCHPTADGLRTC